MPLFLMETRVSCDALHQPKSPQTLERHVAGRIADHCPEVKWIASYAVLGPCDDVDIFEATRQRGGGTRVGAGTQLWAGSLAGLARA